MIYQNLINQRVETLGNKILPTCTTDNPNNWNSKNRYIEEFEYQYNRQGFRCDSFESQSDMPIVFSGCSITMGVGLPISKTWAYNILDKIKNKTRLNIPFWSVATSGSSIELQVLYLTHYIDILKPKFVFCLMPPYVRRHIIVNGKEMNYSISRELSFGPDDFTNNELDIVQQALPLLSDTSYAIFETIKSLILLNEICKRYNTTVIYDNWYDVSINELNENIKGLKNFTNITGSFDIKTDLARDGLHPGPESHINYINNLWPKIDWLI